MLLRNRTGPNLLFLATLFIRAICQEPVLPSNATYIANSYDSAPFYWVNGTAFSTFRITPMFEYYNINRTDFLDTVDIGRLVLVTPSMLRNFSNNTFICLSCDPEDYVGNTTNATVALSTLSNSMPANPIILYSKNSKFCMGSAAYDTELPLTHLASAVFTAVDVSSMDAIVSTLLGSGINGLPARITADPGSYTCFNNVCPSSLPPGTAKALISVYVLSGVGACIAIPLVMRRVIRDRRAALHTYPSHDNGSSQQTLAKGLGRAVLETIPLVKFGDARKTARADELQDDVELAHLPSRSRLQSESAVPAASLSTIQLTATLTNETGCESTPGENEAETMTCSICTEDFKFGESVRVLPCSHTFHPGCIDPWLLSSSSVCPLCRIDLRPVEKEVEC